MPVLIQDPNKHFYNHDQVYIGPGGTAEQIEVVKVNDYVLIWDEGIFRVIAVDGAQVPTLELWDPTENTGGDDGNSGLITGLSGYQPSVIHRAFFDDSQVQLEINLDSRYLVFGVDSEVCKLFLGVDTSLSGTVISVNIAEPPRLDLDLLELVVGQPGTKRPPSIPVQNTVLDGDTVTLVNYSAAGRVMSSVTFVVISSTAFTPLAYTGRILEDVRLISTYINGTDPDQLDIPANIGVQLNIAQAELYYTDGFTEVVPIDGVKCKLLGLDNFNNNLAGTINWFTLVYFADPSEAIINGGANRQISHNYRVVTTLVDLDLAYKVYLGINYNPITDLYGFNLYLTSLEYGQPILLQPGQFTMSDGLGEPLILLRSYHSSADVVDVTIRVNMELVFPALFDDYTYVQQLTLDLNDPVNNISTWIIDYDLDNIDKLDAIYKFKTSSTNSFTELEMGVGATSTQEWLERFYYPISPIFDPALVIPPDPTHFRLRYQHAAQDYTSVDIPVGDWGLVHIPGSVTWFARTSVEIHWLRDNPGNPKDVLGITPVMIIESFL